MNFYPLKFRPIYKQRIWGGQKLKQFFGKNIAVDEKIGESWELADLPNDKSIIANGSLAGRNIEEVIKEYPEQITGNENFQLPFPLLIKILDAEDILSVQVHPDGDTCKKMQTGDPKTECWYVISAAENAVIYKGVKKGVTKENFAKAIKDGSVDKMLTEVVVKAGECHFLPAGTAHAIGAGLLIAEIQTPSDTTYRVFDWNRVDSKGKSRELHIEQAMESIRFDVTADDLPVTTTGRLVDSDYFKIDKVTQRKNDEAAISAGEMKTMMILSGCGRFSRANGEMTEFTAGDCLLIPAVYAGVIYFSAETEYLLIRV